MDLQFSRLFPGNRPPKRALLFEGTLKRTGSLNCRLSWRRRRGITGLVGDIFFDCQLDKVHAVSRHKLVLHASARVEDDPRFFPITN